VSQVTEVTRKVAHVDSRFRGLEQGVQDAIEQFRQVVNVCTGADADRA